MANIDTFFLPAQTQITLTFDAYASGHYVNIGDPGDQPSEFTAVSAGDTKVIGPFNSPKNYRVTLLGGSYTREQSFVGAIDTESAISTSYDNSTSMLISTNVQAAIDELKATYTNFSGNYSDLTGTPDLSVYELHASLATVAESGNYTDLNITPETIIATIGNSATGTEIATAVNAIIAALQAKGLVASS